MTTQRKPGGKPRSRPRWTSAYALPMRCPTCGAAVAADVALRPLLPLLAQVVELVARRAAEMNLPTTSADVAPVFHLSPDEARRALAEATRAGVLRRARQNRVRGGVYYHHYPTRASVAYLRGETLAQATLAWLTRHERHEHHESAR